ncbi:MAG: NADH-quinone oxidoreductase subunit L [Planctomycetaceae bacterium]
MEHPGDILKTLLTIAWLLPLAGFAIEVFGGYWGGRRSKAAAYLAVLCIATGFVCSTAALLVWGNATDWVALEQSEHHDAHGSAHSGPQGPGAHEANGHERHAGTVFSGTFYTLARFGSLVVSLDYYIDSLTLVMFMMVTLVATCIHIFAIGYMSEELTDDYVDHQVHPSRGGHLHRPGRFYLFFSYMSLFCFSMLGLVLAGNIFMVFVFWELVGICSYLLIGFYIERKSACTAANKAFIMNRVGDFGFLIGMMVLWTWFGTFHFGPHEVDGATKPGLFQMARGNDGQLDVDHDAHVVYLRDGEGNRLADAKTGQPRTIPYMLLVVAGLGVFAGCVGKSAQFPLQTWLPDAMEGPTPVSALVHSATMVAAGVYLAGRFYPMFAPDVLLVIAYVGCITLFLAATIAIVATDIKRVLAYSTISQLGYMMLAIGVAGWAAGLFHLITHAIFKSLMFLASGSVIAGCHHEQEMPRMGGLRKKMPITAYTMLVGVIAISGLAIPISLYGFTPAFSGYHSKDAIVATALAFTNLNSAHFLLFWVPLVTAGITAFYMFRLWFYTFAGQPRDAELYKHVHESPWVMTGPLVVLALFAAFIVPTGENSTLFKLLTHSEPAGVAAGVAASGTANIALPGHEAIHAVHSEAGTYALMVALAGAIVAYLLYGARLLDPADIKRQFAGLHHFLVEKWQFDNLYDAAFVRPVRVVAAWCAAIDRIVFDGFLHGICRVGIDVSRWDRKFDENVVDGLVNLVGDVTFSVGRSLRAVQTGRLRQYIMFIALGVMVLFLLLFMFFPR